MKKLENGNYELTRNQLISLLEDQIKLRYLDFAGVDNWDGFDFIWDSLEEDGFDTFTDAAIAEVDLIQ